MNFTSFADRSCSYGLNGSDPEQIVHNKVGRLLLETTYTWNTIFDGMMWLFTYGEISSKKTCINTSNTKDQKYQNIIYRSISVTKESDNKHAR